MPGLQRFVHQDKNKKEQKFLTARLTALPGWGQQEEEELIARKKLRHLWKFRQEAFSRILGCEGCAASRRSSGALVGINEAKLSEGNLG